MNNLFEYLEQQVPTEYKELYQAWRIELRDKISLSLFFHYESGSGDYEGLEDFSKSLLVKALEEAFWAYDNRKQ